MSNRPETNNESYAAGILFAVRQLELEIDSPMLLFPKIRMRALKDRLERVAAVYNNTAPGL